MEHPALKQAKQALEELSANPHARIRAEQREMSRIAYDLTLHAARQEGRADGIIEGEARGKADSVLSVLAARGIPVSDEQVSLIRACRDLEQLDTWLRRAVSASSCEAVLRKDDG